MMQSFPLLAVSFIFYALLTLAFGSDGYAWWEVQSFTVDMMSGDRWKITRGDLFLGFSMALLFVEVLRSTRSGNAATLNNALSVGVFLTAFTLFLSVPGYGNSTFAIFMGMTFLDFMAGFIINTATARRDFALTTRGE